MLIDFIELTLSFPVGFHFLVVATVDAMSMFGEAAMQAYEM